MPVTAELPPGFVLDEEPDGLPPGFVIDADPAPTSYSDYAIEGAKGFAEGAKNLAASSLKGMAATSEGLARQQLEALDQPQPPPADDPFARAAARTRRSVVHPTPDVVAERRAVLEQRVASPITEHPLYQAGEAVEEFGREALAPGPGFEGSWTRDIGGGLGSLGAGIGLALLNPGAAMLTFVTAGQGEAAERAIQAGATPEQIERAALYGTAAGATDVVDALFAATGSYGRALGLIRRVGYGVAAGALAEGGQEGLQQYIQNWIAQGVYNPEQDLLEDVPRSAAVGAIVGGAMGGGMGALPRQQPEAEPQPIPTTSPEIVDAIPPGAVPAEAIAPPAAEPEIHPITPSVIPATAEPVAAPQEAPAVPPPEAAPVPADAQAAQPAAPAPAPAPVIPTPPVEPPEPPPISTVPQLEQLLDDPRTADEIRADVEAESGRASEFEVGQSVLITLPGRHFDDGKPLTVEGTIDIPPTFIGPAKTTPKVRIGNVYFPIDESVRPAPPRGSREAPVRLETPEDVNLGAEITKPNPTPAEIESGIYPKRHLKWQGRDISIETEAGATRTAKDGSWSVVMPVPYGHILGTKGADGDPLDISIGPNPQSPKVFIIDQVNLDTLDFDEHKTFAGFDTEAAAVAAYTGSFSDGLGPDRIGAVTEMPVAQFRNWIARGNTKKALKYQPPKVIKPRAKPKRGPLDIIQFIAKSGGIRSDEALVEDVRTVIGSNNLFVPGFGMLIRPPREGRGGPQYLDILREAAVDAGYIYDTPWEGGVATTTSAGLLDAMDRNQRGDKVYAAADLAEAYERQQKKQQDAENDRFDSMVDEVRGEAKTAGLNVTDEEIREAATLALLEGVDSLDAIYQVSERSSLAERDELSDIVEQESADAGALAPTGTDEAGARPAPVVQPPVTEDQPEAPPERAETGVEPGEAERGAGEAGPAGPVETDNGRPQPSVDERADRRHKRAGGRAAVAEHDTSDDHVVTAYHGSGDAIDRLDPDRTRLGRGLFFASSPQLASRFAEGLATDSDPLKIFGEDTPADIVTWVRGVVGETEARHIGSLMEQAQAAADGEGSELSEATSQLFNAVNDRLRRISAVATGAPNVTRVQLNLGKTLRIDLGGRFDWDAERVAIDRARSGRYDSVTFDNTGDGTFYAIFDAERIIRPPPPSNDTGKSDEAPETGPSDSEAPAEPAIALARALKSRLDAGQPVTSKILQDEAAKAYGGTLAEGKFDRKDMADALELAVNMFVKETRHLRVDSPNPRHAIKMLSDVLDELPTQRVRSEEQESFQQFSTPPNYSAAAAFVANLQNGDVVLEPSAGTGSLVAASSASGVKIIANELSERRAALLRALMGEDARIFSEDAEQIDNILPNDVKPTVVIMNPPFSQTAGRMGAKKDPMVAARHVEQALARLEPGGRLVAIVGRGMAMGQPTYRGWWNKISQNHAVRANIGVDGKVYEKYGTTFGTRLLVIDKVPPTGAKPVTADAQSVDELMRLLEPIRNERPAPQQATTEPSRPDTAAAGEGRRPGASSARPQSGGVGDGERGGGRLEPERPAPGAGEPPVRVEAGERPGVAADQPERPRPAGAAGETGERDPQRGQRKGSVSSDPERGVEPPAGGQPGPATGGERVELEHAAPETQAATEDITESLYESYTPKRVRAKGAKPHPGPLVESASMASVNPPSATYQPHLPKRVIEEGLLSLAQIEPIVYAGQAHSKMLPAAEGDTPKRRGFFIGDGTGVGKGREVAGIILDNWEQGRTKAVWVSEKKTLLQDAKRDWSGLKQRPDLIFDVGKVKAGEKIEAKRGVGFITYDTLKGGLSDQAAIARGGFIRKQQVSVNGQPGTVRRVAKGGRGQSDSITVDLENGTQVTVPAHEVQAVGTAAAKSRVDQLVDWLGAEFDGVIAFDEAHNMGNAVQSRGDRGMKEAAQKALAGMELQKRLPNARVVYVSATGATEVSNLAYADRLGLWGRGTAFASQQQFVSEVEGGGIAAMELIARDMKQLGLYTARNLSYDGVEYERLEHKLNGSQREIYDTCAEAWQVVLRNFQAALEATGGAQDGRAKAAANSAFWGAHQRFFNQIVTSLQMPSVIKAVEKDIAAGRQAVLQLTNTNEASQERAAAKATTAEEIEDLDITPRDQIIQLVEVAFPTQQYEEYEDENGRVRSRPVTDSAGNPVQNKQALRMKEALIERLASIRVPQGPLDLVLDHFGTEVVAEVTGRGRRFVLKADEKTGERRRMEESRPGSANLAETDAFQSGKKKILVFSEAGGTGRSYHADNTAASKDARRVHYLVQGGWRADKAVQGFGRTHRTNQASAPVFKLVTTDLQGQKRFISSIARRLAQLGALTKGQRQAGDQGIFSARDNLESTEANIALRQFYGDLLSNKVEGITLSEFEEQTGLQLRSQDEEGRERRRQDFPPITQFLNRLLSLKIDAQNNVFEAFSQRLDAVIEARAQAGLLDVGLETVRADRITKESERTVHTIEETGAETKHVKLSVANKFRPRDFDETAGSKSRPVMFFAKSPNNKVYAVADAPSVTTGEGLIVDNYRVISPVSDSRMVKRANIVGRDSKWEKIGKDEARRLWDAEIAAAPDFIAHDMHLITGAILPIWDRLRGNARVVRLQTDQGERFIGRVVPSGQISTVLKALGAEAEAGKVTPEGLYDALLKGGSAKLSNGWRFKRSRVAGENRIELIGPSTFSEGNEVKQDGAFSERIDFKTRYFVPIGEDGPKVIGKLIQYRPVVETDEGAAPTATDDDALLALRTSDAIDPTSLKIATPLTLKFMEHAQQVYPLLRKELDRLGLASVGLKLADMIELRSGNKLGTADGLWLRGTITMALGADNKFRTLNHEALHGLRRLGAFTDGEWGILTRASNTRWRKQFDIETKYNGWPEWIREEEGIAHAYGAWVNGEIKVDGRIARLFKRIRDILEAIGNVLRGEGFRTAEDIFRDIRSGKIGARAKATQKRARNEYAVASGDGDLFKTEIVQTPDGPREQTVIPGAEKISQREQAQRKADAPLKPKKPQKGTAGSPLFDEPDTQGSLFSFEGWHGSPHDFRRFSLEHIGTGEGAQAYGWGLYIASRQQVAEYYRKAIAADSVTLPNGERLTVRSQGDIDNLAIAVKAELDRLGLNEKTPDAVRHITFNSDLADFIVAAFDEADATAHKNVIDAAKARLRFLAESQPDELVRSYVDAKTAREAGRSYQRALEAIEKLEGHGLRSDDGRLYKVNVNAEIEHMLDWDKPYEQQTDYVKKALEKVGIKADPPPPKVTVEEVTFGYPPKVGTLLATATGEGFEIQGWRAEPDKHGGYDIYSPSPYRDTSFKGNAPNEKSAREWIEKETRNLIPRDQPRTGQSIYRAVAGDRRDSDNTMLIAGEKAEKAASIKLRDAGIPGIKYLDGGSRSAGDGTHNYVIFDDSLIKIEALFALSREPHTATDRQRAMQGFLARGQFIDRAIRVPFDIFGGTTHDGQWKSGQALFNGASKIITGAKFSDQGRFTFLNPILETARTGLIDRYGLDPEYVSRERQRALDERAVMLEGAELLKTLKDHSVGPEEAKVLQAILTGENVTDRDMAQLAEPIRAAVDQLGQDAVALGLVSGESFERNRGTYLHRVYQKYEAEQSGLHRMVNGIMGSRRKKIIGDAFRGRGLFEEVTVSRLMRDVPEFHEGARGRPQKGDKFVRLDEMPDQARLALEPEAGKDKPLRTIYWPADKAIPDRYDSFRNQGIWEVRGEKAGKLVIWRDFTKAEREQMGEILDARYTIAKTFMLMAHDLSVGKFYQDIAQNEAWTRNATPNERWVDAEEWRAQAQRAFKHGDIAWVRVPTTEIPDSGGKKRWGALSGKWVREEIWRDLNEQEIMMRPGLWRALLTQWKLNKTARSPVVHMNNVMSNFVLMDLIDVRWQDFAAGLRSYIKKDQNYQEAFEHGAFGADMMSQEIRDQVLKPVLEEIMRDNTFQQGGRLGALGQMTKFTGLLWSKLKAIDQKMIDVYRLEDELFRMATYIRRRELGDTPEQAAETAREQFIDYDIRAPWVNTLRSTVLPFISYTYRAVPLVARAVATRPWKLGKYFLLAYMANALAYSLTGDDEDRERRSLPEREQGKTWIGVERMLRMPFDDKYGNPLFLDIRRWMPAGDVFDLQGDLPSWMQIGGPLMIGAELFLNRSAFTGKEIFNDKTDDIWDRTGKRVDHLYKSWMPSAAWVPGSWYWQKVENAVKGATDRQGRPYDIGLALSSSVGIKLKPQDVEEGLSWKAYEFRQVERALAAEARRLQRQAARGLVSEAELNRAMQKILEKRERLQKKAAETLR